jgi:hypothetical protein
MHTRLPTPGCRSTLSPPHRRALSCRENGSWTVGASLVRKGSERCQAQGWHKVSTRSSKDIGAAPTTRFEDNQGVGPTARPTLSPTAIPTVSPTARPTVAPSARPTVAPTARPTLSPWLSPTAQPPDHELRFWFASRVIRTKMSEADECETDLCRWTCNGRLTSLAHRHTRTEGQP